jgi:cell pole-organizing protein PopZ
MSASQSPGNAGTPPANDPSMEDILASIRRILSEEEPGAAPAPDDPPAAAAAPQAPEEKPDDVLVLDPSMLVEDEEEAPSPPPPSHLPAAQPAPPPTPMTAMPMTAMPPMAPVDFVPAAALLAPETEAAASTSVSSLMRTLATERTMQVHRGGPTLEDIVREELRPLLKQWLDANLPDLVERLVQAEIERVVHRAVP